MISKINCMIIDVITNTLATCDYKDCNDICIDYLIDVANNCPVVFHNETYLLLWNTLFNICNADEEQISQFSLD